MKEKIKQSQLAFLLFLVLPGGKFLTIPLLLATFSGRDGWIAMSILFLLDFLCLIMILVAMKNNKCKNIKEILEKSLSPVVASVVFFVLGVMALLRLVGGTTALLGLLESSLSVVTNWIAFALPLSAVMIFCVSNGIRTLGRMSQILIFVVVFAVVTILLFSLPNADFGNLKPILIDGMKPVWEGVLNTSFWFSDFLFVILLFGEIKKGKNFFAKILTSFALGAIATVFLDMVYMALFGNLSVVNNNAIAKVAGFTVLNPSQGRLDSVLVLLWLTTVLLKSMVSLWMAAKCFSYTFAPKNQSQSKQLWIMISCCMVLLIVPMFVPVAESLEKYVADGFGKYVFLVPQYLLPLAMPLLVRVANKKSGGGSLQKGQCDSRDREESLNLVSKGKEPSTQHSKARTKGKEGQKWTN